MCRTSNYESFLVPNNKICIYRDVETSISEVLTERNILGAHVSENFPIFSFNLDERVAKVWILQLLDDTFATREETHSVIGYRDVLLLLLRILGSHELERPSLFEILSVPLLNTCIVLEIRHSIETRNDWVLFGIFDEFDHLLGCKDNIGID